MRPVPESQACARCGCPTGNPAVSFGALCPACKASQGAAQQPAPSVGTLHLHDTEERALCGFWPITNCMTDNADAVNCVDCLRAEVGRLVRRVLEQKQQQPAPDLLAAAPVANLPEPDGLRALSLLLDRHRQVLLMRAPSVIGRRAVDTMLYVGVAAVERRNVSFGHARLLDDVQQMKLDVLTADLRKLVLQAEQEMT